jgi:hypothetical protein
MGAALAALALLALAYLVLRKRKDTARKSGWRIEHSPGMPSRPVPDGDGWGFTFPTNPASHVHYVQNFDPPSLEPGKSIRVRFRVSNGVFVPQEWPDEPATVSLLIQRKGDDWTARGEMAAYRWYSSHVIPLAAGEYELRAQLIAGEWGDVYGGHDPTAFEAALRNADNIGLCFGSAGGRGHGVLAQSQAKFELISMGVE